MSEGQGAEAAARAAPLGRLETVQKLCTDRVVDASDSRQRANSLRTHWSVVAAHHGVGVLLGGEVFVSDA